MTVYHLAQLRVVISQNDPPVKMDEHLGMLISVNATDPALLEALRPVFDKYHQRDQEHHRLVEKAFYLGITNVHIQGSKVTVHSHAELTDLTWELLASIGAQGWEPYASSASKFGAASEYEDYCFRKAVDH